MVETFLVESWLEHLRQHERVTNADRVLQETIQQFQTQGAPKITHLIAADRRPRNKIRLTSMASTSSPAYGLQRDAAVEG